MGQNNSINVITDILESIQDEMCKHAKNVTEISLLSYEEFLDRLKELNNLCNKLMLSGGEKFYFFIKNGSDSSILWKATIRIRWVLFDPESKNIIFTKLINLNTFLKIFKMVHNEIQLIESTNVTSTEKHGQNFPPGLVERLNEVFNGNTENNNTPTECCICLERKPDVVLPCSHQYCQQCISQWNVNHNTCPVCRTVTNNADECWILPDVPENDEIVQYISTHLMDLVEDD